MKTTHIISILSVFIFLAYTSSAGNRNDPSNFNGFFSKKLYSILSKENSDGPVKIEKKQPVEVKLSSPDANMLLPADQDLNYLRFDLNNYINNDAEEITELPVSDMDYLKFDVNEYINENPVDLDELPINEYEHLRFDVNFYINADKLMENNIGELPIKE